MRFLGIALSLVTAACGGATESDLFGSTSNEAGTDGSPISQDSSTIDASVHDATTEASDCAQHLARLETLRQAATTCNVQSGGACQKSINDLCCPLVVTSPDSADAKIFEADLASYEKQCGKTPCPAIACMGASGVCSPTGHCLQ